MSGGIDSTVAAMILLKQGYEIIGITYRTFDSISKGCMEKEKGCCSVDSIFEAKRMAKQLGFEHHIIDFRENFKECVISNFIQEYLSGRTPNPCVVCNSEIKWGKLIEIADEYGCDYIATGHYAKVAFAKDRFFLQQGKDKLKDQTYFLWTLTQDNLSRTLFPLGDLTKSEVRQIAFEEGFEKLSKKRESQEICFIPNNDYRQFLKEQVPESVDKYADGYFVNSKGERLGRHRGFPNYTIGQRKGLGIAMGEPMYVIKIIPDENLVVLGTKEELQGNTLIAKNINVSKYDRIPEGLLARVKIRYRSKGEEAYLYQEDNQIRVVFKQSVNSITPGQSVVFYEGEDLVGGGIIM